MSARLALALAATVAGCAGQAVDRAGESAFSHYMDALAWLFFVTW